jgi:hypothetical protein
MELNTLQYTELDKAFSDEKSMIDQQNIESQKDFFEKENPLEWNQKRVERFHYTKDIRDIPECVNKTLDTYGWYNGYYIMGYKMIIVISQNVNSDGNFFMYRINTTDGEAFLDIPEWYIQEFKRKNFSELNWEMIDVLMTSPKTGVINVPVDNSFPFIRYLTFDMNPRPYTLENLMNYEFILQSDSVSKKENGMRRVKVIKTPDSKYQVYQINMTTNEMTTDISEDIKNKINGLWCIQYNPKEMDGHLYVGESD